MSCCCQMSSHMKNCYYAISNVNGSAAKANDVDATVEKFAVFYWKGFSLLLSQMPAPNNSTWHHSPATYFAIAKKIGRAVDPLVTFFPCWNRRHDRHVHNEDHGHLLAAFFPRDPSVANQQHDKDRHHYVTQQVRPLATGLPSANLLLLLDIEVHRHVTLQSSKAEVPYYVGRNQRECSELALLSSREARRDDLRIQH
mmetsp:Transcript_21069/g.34819  ORF Transcript_21069/g.34819 Transcript_21069/m.34819 type:complete len:198 (-) Transcript_21069:561-1154(-)